MLLYERWYDLYHQPDGQTADRKFAGETAAGSSEAVWGDPAHFDMYDGVGDSAIWTGTSLVAYALRYVQTGTAADYGRMEDKVRTLLTLFDVTGIPGYLARHHILLMEPDAPQTDRHIFFHDPGLLDFRDHEFDPDSAPDLPAVYVDGYDDGETVHHGTPMWHGNPSIDQYSGPMTAFPLVYALLRDESLKQRIAEHMTCYLKRLQRLEIRNLQMNPDALEAVQTFFAGGYLDLDPGDPDFSTLDTLVTYVLLQPNSTNESTFDRTCPDEPAVEAYRVLDAAADDFMTQMFSLAIDLQARDYERPKGIDHLYVVSLNGAHAMHLMNLAAMAYYFTGDDMYRRFLFDELIGGLGGLGVADTMSAMQKPHWCRTYYSSHITFAPLWSFVSYLGDSELRDSMHDVMETEMWQKEMSGLGNALYNLMYAGTVPDSVASSKDEALAAAVEALETLGGNGGVLDDPRRTYSLDRQWVLDNLPGGIGTVCPSEDERAMCEEGFEFYGIPLPGVDITAECIGAPGECPVGDGCAKAIADSPLPMSLRIWEDFMWQRSPLCWARPTRWREAGSRRASISSSPSGWPGPTARSRQGRDRCRPGKQWAAVPSPVLGAGRVGEPSGSRLAGG
ncbi:MAG: hypothetical protein ABIJ56_07400 [Pseudomonadota bacterium]